VALVTLKNRAMTPKEFHEKFPTEFACWVHWKAMREKARIVCNTDYTK